MGFLPTPPEVISNQMYAGPGAGSLHNAAWQLRQMAHSVKMTALSLNNTLGELHENWKGGSSDLMADAVTRYLPWLLYDHFDQIMRTAYEIEILAGAYETTRQMVIHPADIAANREELDRLIASNVAEVNTPAIADLDAQYEQYRAQNLQAMDRYRRWTGLALSKLPRWQEPPQIHGSE
ncbi:PPE family protein [Mycobacterium canetti]|uniref:PPE family protein n=1 Tax=Mycobacterium canetti TaxID=78331 RepID=UPI001E35B63F|nr:PPE family protein [Mycobacterium canetti]